MRKVYAITVYLILLSVSGIIAQTFPRQDLRISANWMFYRGDPANAQQVSFSDASWDTVCLPHTERLESGISHAAWDYYIGPCWYRKSFIPDTSFKGKKVFLEFEAAMQSSSVYMNGTLIYSYLGGYNPFTIDITSKIKFDSTNVIAVRLDNTVNTDVSPGNVEPDFYYFGGLYRYVNLHVMDSLHITDAVYANKIAGGGVFVTDSVLSSSSAIVWVKTNVINEYATSRTCVLKTVLVDSNSADLQNVSTTMVIPAGKDTTFSQSFTVSNPRLWHPNTPNLYSIRSEVYDDTRAADIVKTTFGVRTISFTRSGGLVLNGSRIYGRGANRHQDYACIGNAVPVSGQYRDALRLKEGGFNFVRLSHYLQHPAFLDACDKMGIMVQASIVGWQYTAGYSNTTFSANLRRDLRTMIRYYRNHPSIIMWESAMNESSPTKAWCDSAQTIAHAEYPGNQMYTCGQESNNVLDIYQAAVQQGGRTYTTTKPAAISEYGHWEYNGFTSTSNQPRANGEAGMRQQAQNHAEALSTDRALSWLTVDGVWVYNDYFGFSSYANSLCSGGIVDQFRIPKYSYYFFRSQRDPKIIINGVNSGPSVYIASFWTSSSNLTVRVFSNCDSVALYLNETLVSKKGPVTGTKLEHPPFEFTVTSFAAGVLRADGIINKQVVASHTIRTPVAAARVLVEIDTANQQLLADGSDIAIVYASIVDTNGTLIPAATDKVTFSVSGPGSIVAADGNPLSAAAGIAAVYLRSKYNNAGLITVTASASGLVNGSATVRTVNVSDYVTAVSEFKSKTTPISAHYAAFKYLSQNRTLVVYGTFTSGISHFTLYNAQGRIVKNFKIGAGKGMAISLASCAQGIYYGKISTGSLTYSKKILITN